MRQKVGIAWLLRAVELLLLDEAGLDPKAFEFELVTDQAMRA